MLNSMSGPPPLPKTEPPPPPAKDPKKPKGCFQTLQIAFLVLSVPLLLLVITVAVIEPAPSGGAENTESPSVQIDSEDQLELFTEFVERAQSASVKILKLEQLSLEMVKAESPMSSADFTRRSITIRDEIEEIRADFESTFGATVKDYPGSFNGYHPQIFLRCSAALNRLFNFWYEWHLISVGRKSSGDGLKTEMTIYMEEIVATQDLIDAALRK